MWWFEKKVSLQARHQNASSQAGGAVCEGLLGPALLEEICNWWGSSSIPRSSLLLICCLFFRLMFGMLSFSFLILMSCPNVFLLLVVVFFHINRKVTNAGRIFSMEFLYFALSSRFPGKKQKKKVFSDVEYLHHLSFIYSEVIFELIKEMKLHLTVENYVQIFLRHTKNLIIQV